MVPALSHRHWSWPLVAVLSRHQTSSSWAVVPSSVPAASQKADPQSCLCMLQAKRCITHKHRSFPLGNLPRSLGVTETSMKECRTVCLAAATALSSDGERRARHRAGQWRDPHGMLSQEELSRCVLAAPWPGVFGDYLWAALFHLSCDLGRCPARSMCRYCVGPSKDDSSHPSALLLTGSK